MRPRMADPRIGIFYQGVSDFRNGDSGLKHIYYAQRWRLEPSDETAFRMGQLVEPKKPIVFYVDTLFPEAWKQPIREGILRWNQAFEKIGFRNVVRVMDFPKDDPDFNANNIKYSTIRYAPLWLDIQNSMHVDPRTGEIINADINQRLIENIFFKNSPLHDGAMVISKKRIKAAGCILPVSHNLDIPKELGLRHRAAMGISQVSDAHAIIVSEETGGISVAYKGQFYLRLNAEELESLLTKES